MGLRIFAASMLLVVSVASAYAETKAVITGPETAQPGELVVLNSFLSEGDNHRWISPEGISTAVAGCEAINSQIFFATPTPGKYTFTLIVADKEATIEYDTHTVVIAGSVVDPGPDPDPDPDPHPTPTPILKKAEELSRQNALKLNDSATQQALYVKLDTVVGALEAACARGQCPTLQDAKSSVVSTIETVLLARRGSSLDANWALVWRQPNSELLSSFESITTPDYTAIIRAITNGLK